MSNTAYVTSVLSDHFVELDSNLSQNDVVERMADIVRQLSAQKRLTVSIVGGAASGKTTITKELVMCLQKSGCQADVLSTDNYVIGNKRYRQVVLKNADAQKKYDFMLMDQHVQKIRQLTPQDSPIRVPEIDAKTGIAVDEPNNYSHEIGYLDALIIEGDFPRDDYDVRFYIQVPDQQRLENNIDRDAQQAGDAATVVQRFNDRQRTLHKPYTLPALQSADYVLVADVKSDDWIYALHQRER